MRRSAQSPKSNPLAQLRPGFFGRLLSRFAGCADASPITVEGLESRTLLSGTPLPAISALENANNPVVRWETTFGDVDIELFSFAGTGGNGAPNTVTNFLNYVTSGRYDETFFHRSIPGDGTANSIGILQGGGFRYKNGTGLAQPTRDGPINFETSGRTNAERTIAMARTQDPNSATAEFFINYVDNLNLSTPSNNYAVFGRVIQGWNNILTIRALTTRNLTNDPAFSGTSLPIGTTDVPTTANYNQASGVRENALVNLINAELIKPIGNSGFFAQEVAYPEGFRSPFSTETLNLFNPNGTLAKYQIIARYERYDDTTQNRDVVIASGDLDANQKLQIDLANPGTGRTAVRSEVPYALVVQTSLPVNVVNPQAIVAASNRRDFGANVGDSFFPTTGVATGADSTALRTWDFARVERGDSSREFLIWQNLTEFTATVTVSFYSENTVVPDTFQFTLAPYRRGGVEVYSLGLDTTRDTNGNFPNYSARITSDRPIVAALSDWDLPLVGVDANGAYTPAYGGLGIAGGGTTIAALSNLEIKDNFTNQISLFNPNTIPVVVVLSYWTTGRTPGTSPAQETVVVLANSRKDVELDRTRTGTASGDRFSVSYTSSGNQNIAAAYTSFDGMSRNLNIPARLADGIQMNFEGSIAATAGFADGLIDPNRDATTQSEVVSIYNPFASTDVTFSYTIIAVFSDQSTITISTGTIGSRQRLDVELAINTALRAKAASDPAFRNYGILVTGTAAGTTSGTVNTPGIVSLIRKDTALGQSVALNPLWSGTALALTDAIFLPGTSGIGG